MTSGWNHAHASLPFLLVLAAATGVRAQVNVPPAVEDIRQLERTRFEAMVRADTATLRQILSTDLTYTHTTGQTETKEEFLRTVATGRIDYVAIQPESLDVRLYAQTAVVTGRSRMHVGQQQFSIQFLDVYRMVRNSWELVAWQATRLPDSR